MLWVVPETKEWCSGSCWTESQALSFQEPMCRKEPYWAGGLFMVTKIVMIELLSFTLVKFSLLTPCLGEEVQCCWFHFQARSSGPLSISCLFSLLGALQIDAALSLWSSVGRLAAVHQVSEIKFSSTTERLCPTNSIKANHQGKLENKSKIVHINADKIKAWRR